MLTALRHRLFRQLRLRGMEIRKAPGGEWEPLSVFRLAVEALMLRRGAALSFVQIGANDGVFSDPIRDYILTRGWHGVLVEPQPDVFERLKGNYPGADGRLRFEQLAIGPAGTLTLYRPPRGLADDWGLSVVSADPRVAARSLKISQDQLERIEVPSITLATLMERHAIDKLDVLQIDVEGLDWQILQTLDFSRLRPTLIQIESGQMPRGQITEAVHALNGHGYDVYFGGWQGDMLALRRDWLDES